MILWVGILLGLAATFARARWTRRSIRPPDLSLVWLVFAAVIPQILAFEIKPIERWIPEEVVPLILIVSLGLLLVFAVVNLRQPGFWVMGLGLIANLLVILFNSGWMPVSPETLQRMLPTLPATSIPVGHRLTFTKDWIIPSADIRLEWLSDRFILPGWIPYKVAFSAGDVLIAAGAFIILWELSSQEKRSNHEPVSVK